MGGHMDHGARLQAWLADLGFQGDEEMERTGERVTAFLRDWLPSDDAPEISLCAAQHGNGPVAVRDIPFYSLCAHHLLPFWGTATVAYVPGVKLAGLGAIPRVVRHFARRPQLQERLADQIAEALYTALDPPGLVVFTRARHFCMEMRGDEAGDVQVTVTRGDVDALLLRQLD